MPEWFGSAVESGEVYRLPGIILLVCVPIVYLIRRLVRREVGRRTTELDILREKYLSLFNACSEAVLIFSRDDGRVIDGNLSLCRLLECGRRDLHHMNVQSVILPGDSPESRQDLSRLLGGEAVDSDLLRMRTGAGDLVPVSIGSTLIPDGTGRVRLVQTVIRNLSVENSLQSKLSRRQKMLAAFGEITKLLNTGEDARARFNGLVRVIHGVMECDITSIVFFEPGDERATGFQHDAEEGDQIIHVTMDPEGDSIYRTVASTRRPLLVRELTGENGHDEDRRLYDRGIRSYLVLPLLVRDRVMGSLNIFSRNVNAFQDDDVEVLESIASHLTLGVNNIQLQRDAEKRAQRLKQILVTSNSFRLQVFLDDLLKEIVWSIRFSTGFDFVVLNMLNGETKRVEVKALADNEKSAMKRLIGTTYSWESFRTLMKEERKISHSYLVDRSEPVLARIKEFVRGEGETAARREYPGKGEALFVPIETRLGKIVGFLLVDDSRERGGHSIETIQTMEIFANEVAVVIDNQRLFEETKRKGEELEALNRELQVSKASLEKAKQMLEASNKELERANMDLREVDRLKAEFLQNVTHELRTPLAPIMVNSEVLLLKKIGDLTPVQEEIVQSIFQSTKRLNSLIDDLLDLTKMEAGKMKYQFARVNPESLVNNSLVETYPFSQEKRITIHRHIECGDLQIHGDSSRLIQLLTNLLRNAIKFTPEDGRIDLSVRQAESGGRVELKVSDTGIGIPAEKLDKIFDRFYQVDGSATRKYKGAGLGLAIVKKIVEAHRGEIRVESREGVGTTFTILLPALSGETDAERLVTTFG
jgi:PAS domain S-box-containing protein